MSEKGPLADQGFDTAAVAKALGMRSAAIQPIRHSVHGEGLSFPLLVSHGQVDVFPAVGVTCVTLANVHIELFRRAAPQAWEDQVLFPSASAADEASLTRQDDGSLDFHYTHFAHPAGNGLASASPEVPLPDLSNPQATRDGSTGTSVHQSPDTPLPEPLRASRTPSNGDAPPDRAAERDALSTDHSKAQDEQEESPRVTLTGRLGRSPTFRTTQAGTLVARFPVAQHTEDGDTVWHSVLAFGERAVSLQKRAEQGELPKGLAVEVVGYSHRRDYQSRTGQTKQATEIYAAALRRLQAPRSGATGGHHPGPEQPLDPQDASHG